MHSDDQQRFNKAGVPTFAFFFLILMSVACFFLVKKFKPRNVVSGKMNVLVKALQAACILQSVSGLFMVYSTAQNIAITLMIIPLLGVVSLQVMDPTGLVLYAALQFFFINNVASLPDTFQNGGCTSKFGNEDYCKAGWRSFLTFLAVLYHFVSLVTALCHFYFFMTFHVGPLETSEGGIYASLLTGSDGQQQQQQQQQQQGGYQAQSYQQGPEAYQQASAPPTKQQEQDSVPF
eukprot:m.30509 g.30509  ORF g.30509 m.30509 type:complete len:234 (-) comp6234_c0_seq1:761-1462(-)